MRLMDCLSLYLRLSDVRLSEWSHRLNFQTMSLCFSYSLCFSGSLSLSFSLSLNLTVFCFRLWKTQQTYGLDLRPSNGVTIGFSCFFPNAPYGILKNKLYMCQYFKEPFFLTWQHLLEASAFIYIYIYIYRFIIE